MSRRAWCLLLIGLFAVGLRCQKIGDPFIDTWSWRQSDVAAIARNFSENGFHFARPQIDWAGGAPGYVGTEFPLLPFAAALLYHCLGVHEWIGRALTIFFFAASLPFFYAIVRRAWNENAALLALIFYSFAPLMVAAGRAFLPDVPSLALALAGYYFFQRWLDRERRADLVNASAMIALSILLKAPTAVIGAPLLALAWEKYGRDVWRRPALWLFAFVALAPSASWYWHAHRIAQENYPYHFFGDGGVRVMNWKWYARIFALVVQTSLTPILVLCAVVGVWLSRREKNAAPLRWWLIGMLAFVVVVGYGNRHPWYQLPLVPIAAAFAGIGLVRFAAQRAWLLVVIVLGFCIWSAWSLPVFLRPVAKPLWRLGLELRERTSANALIVIADDGDPTALYYAHRKGWHFLERDGIFYGNPVDDAQLADDLALLRARGATHLAFPRAQLWWLDSYPAFTEQLQREASLVSASANFRVYEFLKR